MSATIKSRSSASTDRAHAEPALETRHGLMQEHAEAVDDFQAAVARARAGTASRAARRSRSVAIAVFFARPPRNVERASSCSPAEVALTMRSACGNRALRVGRGRSPIRVRRNASPALRRAPRVRFASETVLKPASISACRTAREAPPAPMTSAVDPVRHSGRAVVEIGGKAVGVGVVAVERGRPRARACSRPRVFGRPAS